MIPRVLGTDVYASRLDAWFALGGRRGRGILFNYELAALAAREFRHLFKEGDLETIRFGKDHRAKLPKWRNQLAWAVIHSRVDERGPVIVRYKTLFYHLDYVSPTILSMVTRMIRPKRSKKKYRYVRLYELER